MVAMAAAAVAAFVYLRILVAMYLEDPDPAADYRLEVPTGTGVVIGVACAGVLLIGLAPGSLLDIASDAVPVLVGG
jgi:NADH-quinone oxidoreductase subunit N